jgi:hypothetical protein
MSTVLWWVYFIAALCVAIVLLPNLFRGLRDDWRNRQGYNRVTWEDVASVVLLVAVPGLNVLAAVIMAIQGLEMPVIPRKS